MLTALADSNARCYFPSIGTDKSVKMRLFSAGTLSTKPTANPNRKILHFFHRQNIRFSLEALQPLIISFSFTHGSSVLLAITQLLALVTICNYMVQAVDFRMQSWPHCTRFCRVTFSQLSVKCTNTSTKLLTCLAALRSEQTPQPRYAL